MPPKQQDMSVRDEDQLARDQSLDQLKDQLRASLGYEGGADGLVSMESGELHRFMGELGDKIAEHDRLIVAPPWLAKLQAQVARLEGEVVDLRGSLGGSAPRSSSSGARSGAARLARARRGARAGGVRRGARRRPPRRRPRPRGARRRLRGRPRGAPAARPAAGRAAPRGRARRRGREAGRQGAARDLRHRARPPAEDGGDRALRGEIQALKDMYGGKLKALKTFLSEKLTKIERDVRMEASADATRIETALVEGEAKSNEELEALRDRATALGEALEALRDDARRQHGVLDQRITADRQDVDAQLEEARADGRELQDAMKETEDLVQGLQRNLDEAGEREAEVRALLDDAARERDETKAEVQDDFQKLRQALEASRAAASANQGRVRTERRVTAPSRSSTRPIAVDGPRRAAQGRREAPGPARGRPRGRDGDGPRGPRADLAAHKERLRRTRTPPRRASTSTPPRASAAAATVKGYEPRYHGLPRRAPGAGRGPRGDEEYLDERGARQDTWNAATAAAHMDLAERESMRPRWPRRAARASARPCASRRSSARRRTAGRVAASSSTCGNSTDRACREPRPRRERRPSRARARLASASASRAGGVGTEELGDAAATT